jgi:hypothetical protein
VLSPVQQAALLSQADETAETADLRIDRFPRLLSWLRELLRCNHLGHVLQLDSSDASGQALLLLLQTCLYLQKANQHPALLQQATTAAAFAAERLPAAAARDYSTALFPPGGVESVSYVASLVLMMLWGNADLQLLLGAERNEVADKTQYFADYNASAQQVKHSLWCSRRVANRLHRNNTRSVHTGIGSTARIHGKSKSQLRLGKSHKPRAGSTPRAHAQQDIRD